MAASPLILPDDQWNRQLVGHAHPPDWKNPTATGRYNLVAIGGGSAGIISALGAAGLGGRSALVERRLLGGDCLNFGCVPSKALLRAARSVHQARRAADLGLNVSGDPNEIFAQAMQQVRQRRAQIAPHDSAQRFAGLGVDVFLGEARFTGLDSLQVAGQTIRFARCVIATGGSPSLPDVPGLSASEFLTSETIFSLTELPRRLVVLGGGPVGCELGQAFRRLGSEVTIIGRNPRLLPKEDPSASAVLQAQLTQEGIALHLGARVLGGNREGGQLALRIQCDEREMHLPCDAILAAVGRTPNLAGLGLEAASVATSSRGVTVDDFLRTTNPRIFAAGDVIGGPQFTHAADAMARACLQNALFCGRQRLSRLLIPRTTYTDPEMAAIGLTAQQAAEQNIPLDTYREDLRNVDRAVLDGEETGFAEIHCRRGGDRIVGATIVASHAGEMIGELAVMMTGGLRLRTLAKTIHCYPTQAEVLKRIADQYQRTRLTPLVSGLFRRWLGWRRG